MRVAISSMLARVYSLKTPLHTTMMTATRMSTVMSDVAAKLSAMREA